MSAEMTPFDTEMIGIVQKLLEDHGIDVTFHITPAESYNPGTGEVLAANLREYTVRSTPPEMFSDKYADGEMIWATDLAIYVNPRDTLEFEVKPGIEVTVGERKFKVIRAFPTYTGNVVAIYKLQLRD